MDGPAPAPKLDNYGVPHCTGEGCPLFDGKRCRGTGFEPDSVCEPAVRELAEKVRTFTEAARG